MIRLTGLGAAARPLVGALALLLAAQGAAAAEEETLLQELERERAARAELETMVEQLRATVEELKGSRDEAVQRMEGLTASVESLRAQIAPQAREGEEVGTTKEWERRYQAEREILERRGGVLLPAGQLVFEPGVEYTNLSRNRIQISGFSLIPALIIGTIDTVEIDRDFYRGFLATRYGLTDWLEAEVTVPYLYRRDTEIFGAVGSEEKTSLSGDGLGDITGGLFAQVARESGWIPDATVNFRFAAPTGEDVFEVDTDDDGNPTELPIGSGFWGLSAGATVVKTVDPAVLFGSASYFWNLSDTKSGFGKIDPGDTFEWNVGLAFALNERVALSLSTQHRITGRTKVDGEKIIRTDVNAATLFAGLSYRLSQWTSINFNVGVGITEDAPDLTFELRMPLRMPFRMPVLDIPSPPWFAQKKGDRTVLIEDEAVASRWRSRDIARF